MSSASGDSAAPCSPAHLARVVLLTLTLLLLGGVRGTEASDPLSSGARPSFRETPLLRMGLVADTHYDTFPAGEKAPWQPLSHWFQEQVKRTSSNKQRYDVARDKMEEAVEMFNLVENMTLVVNLGDLVNNDLMWNLRPILDSFNKVRAPHYSLLGNHDLRAHNDRFGKSNSTQHEWIRTKLVSKGDEWYFALEVHPFRLIFIDSMTLEPEAKDDAKKKQHLRWLEEQLAAARINEQPVILFAHIPIGFETNVLLGPVLRSYEHIVAAFFGHHHKGGYVKQRGAHCVILQGQIETLVNAFAIVDVFHDRLELTGFGRVPSRVLPIEPATARLIQKRLSLSRGAGTQTVEVQRGLLEAQGFQPLPPDAMWPREELQKPPPLQLNIPNYRKPTLGRTEPNPGDTQFLRFEFPALPRLPRIPSPEDPVDLTSARAGKPTWLILSGRETKMVPQGGEKQSLVPETPSYSETSSVIASNSMAADERMPRSQLVQDNSQGEALLGNLWLIAPAGGLIITVGLLCVVVFRLRRGRLRMRTPYKG